MKKHQAAVLLFLVLALLLLLATKALSLSDSDTRTGSRDAIDFAGEGTTYRFGQLVTDDPFFITVPLPKYDQFHTIEEGDYVWETGDKFVVQAVELYNTSARVEGNLAFSYGHKIVKYKGDVVEREVAQLDNRGDKRFSHSFASTGTYTIYSWSGSKSLHLEATQGNEKYLFAGDTPISSFSGKIRVYYGRYRLVATAWFSLSSSSEPPQPPPPPPGYLHVNATLYMPYKQAVKVNGNYVWVPEKIKVVTRYSKFFTLLAEPVAYVPNKSEVVWSRSGNMGFYPKTVWGPRLSGDYIVYVSFTGYSEEMALAVVKEGILYPIVTVPVMRKRNNVFVGYGYVYVHLDNERVGIYKWKKGLLSYTFKIYPALSVYFDHWLIDGKVRLSRNITVVVGSGDRIWATAVYTAGQPTRLVVGTNVDGAVRVSGMVDGSAVSFTVSSGQNWSYTILRGFEYTLRVPNRIVLASTTSVLRGRAEGKEYTADSSKKYTGLYNITLTLTATVAQRATVNVYLYAVNGSGSRLLGSWSRGYWTSWSIRLSNVRLDGESLRLVFNTTSLFFGFRFDYNLELENSSYLTFKMWLLNNTPLYGTDIQGTVLKGQTIYLKAIYGRQNDTYAGPILPEAFVPLFLYAGDTVVSGDFVAVAIDFDEENVYIRELSLPVTIRAEMECRMGHKVVTPHNYTNLPRVMVGGRTVGYLLGIESPLRLGPARLCVNNVCYVYNVTRLVLRMDRVEYNETHAIIHVDMNYECCPSQPVREKVRLMAIVSGERLEGPLQEGVLAVPYSILENTATLKIYARYEPGGPVPLHTPLSVPVVVGTVKPLKWMDEKGVVVLSRPYLFPSGLGGTSEPWKGDPGRVVLVAEDTWQVVEARWNGTAFIADFGRNIEGVRIRIIWVPPDTIDIVVASWRQRW